MSCCCGKAVCEATAQHFCRAVAEADLKRYRRKGPDKRARLLIEGLTRTGLSGSSVLDVGAGLGMVTFELIKRGARDAVLADASPAYLDAAREETQRFGLTDRIRYVPGDFVETSKDVAPADVVVLDRAVCCYPAWRPLLEEAAARCRHAFGLTYPRPRIAVRLMLGLENLRRRWSGSAFRAFVHPPAEMDTALRQNGLRRVSRAETFFWHVDVYVRDDC
jgi:magnesium-protoporphyrin O-methyltransferase